MGGMSSEMHFFHVTFQSGQTQSVVIKFAGKATSRLRVSRVVMGLARSAYFYNELAMQLHFEEKNKEWEYPIIPKHFYAEGSMEDGSMLLILETLPNAVPSGVFFGPGNPNNWDISESSMRELNEGNPNAIEMCKQTFRLYARLHATFWNQTDLLDKSWLRSVDWRQGKNRESWEASQAMASSAWETLKQEITMKNASSKDDAAIDLDPHVRNCLDVAVSKINFEQYVKECSTIGVFTLVHGDAHPHNCLWVNQRTKSARPCLIDFEMIGVGSPAQELGQYMISHMTPTLRRKHERELVTVYHEALRNELKALDLVEESERFTFERCWDEYVQGGAGRWAWFVPVFRGKPAMCQFFHDQLSAFLHDHIIDPNDMPMPRV